MKLAQRKIKWLARLMLVLVIFSQVILDANACVAPTASPVRAYTMAQHEDDAMPCHEQENSNANACLSHCTQSDQVNVDQQSAQLPVPVSVIAWVSSQTQAQHILPAIFLEHLVPDTGPPIPIRFCSFLN